MERNNHNQKSKGASALIWCLSILMCGLLVAFVVIGTGFFRIREVRAAISQPVQTEQPTEPAALEPEPTPEVTPGVEPTATPAPTVTPEISETADPSGTHPEDSAAAAKAENPDETEEGDASFLQRLWRFLLGITPWALGIVVVVLFLVTYVIRARQRKGK